MPLLLTTWPRQSYFPHFFFSFSLNITLPALKVVSNLSELDTMLLQHHHHNHQHSPPIPGLSGLNVILLLLVCVVVSSLRVDDGRVCIGCIVRPFGFVREVSSCKKSARKLASTSSTSSFFASSLQAYCTPPATTKEKKKALELLRCAHDQV